MAELASGLRRRLSSWPRAYLAANLMLLAAGGLLAALLLRPASSPADARLQSAQAARLAALVAALPDAAGGWRGEVIGLDASVADVLRYDWSAARAYLQGREVIWLYAFRSRDEKAFLLRAHTPPLCTITQGWHDVVVSAEPIVVAGTPVQAQRMVAEKDGQRQVTYYWEFRGAHAGDRGQPIADTYTVQASSLVTGSPEATAAMLRGFLAELSPASGPSPAARPTPADAPGGRLVALNLSRRALRPGERLEIAAQWEGPAAGQVAAVLVDAQGRIQAEARSPVIEAAGPRPAESRTALELPAGLPAGRYDVHLKRHSAAGALLVFVSQDGTPVAEVRELVVVKPARPLRTGDVPCQGPPIATLGQDLALLCYRAPAVLQAGQPFTLTLYWQARRVPERDYSAFLRLRDPAGALVRERPAEPVGGGYPTAAWEAGEIVADVRTLPTEGLPTGAYRFEIGLFDYWDPRDQGVTAEGREHDRSRLVLDRVVVKTPPGQSCPMSRRVSADLGGEVALLGYDLDWQPGQPLRVTLCWQAQRRMDADYSVFAHLLGPDGQILAQHDGWPADDRYPTSAWDPGEIVTDARTLDTAGLPAGTYRLAVGMYDLRTMQRLPLRADGASSSDNRLLLPVDR